MGAGDIRAGGGYVELWLEKSKVSQGLKQVKDESAQWASQISSLGVGLAALGAGIIAPLALSARAFAETGGRIDDFSQRLGVGTAAISELQYAAERSGTTIDALEKGFGKMSMTIAGAVQGETAAVEALRKLGLSAQDLRGKAPDQQFAMLAEQIAAISDVNLRTDLVTAIFGKSGGDLIPLLSTGAAGIAQLREEAKRLGLSMSEEDVKAAAEFGDSLDDLAAASRAVMNTIGAALAPALKTAADLMVGITAPVREFIKNNRVIITVAAAAGAALLAAGGALTVFGIGLTLIGTAVAGLTALGGVLAAIALSPVTWIVAAGAAVVGVVGYVSGGFSRMIDLGNQFSGEFTAVIQGIANAIKAGNLDRAMDIAVAGLGVAWLAGINVLKATWRSFTDFVFASLSGTLGAIINEMHAFATEFKAATGIDIGTELTGKLGNPFDPNKRKASSEAAAKLDAAQLAGAKAALEALIQSVAPDARTSFGRVPDLDGASSGAAGKDSKSGKADGTAEAMTARGAIGLASGFTLQQRMASDLKGIHDETKKLNARRASKSKPVKPKTPKPAKPKPIAKAKPIGVARPGVGLANQGFVPAGVDPAALVPDVPLEKQPDVPLAVGNAVDGFPALPADLGAVIEAVRASDNAQPALAAQTSVKDPAPKEGPAAERTAKAAEQTARETKRLAEKAEQGILFGT